MLFTSRRTLLSMSMYGSSKLIGKVLTYYLHCQLGPIVRARRHVLNLPQREHAVYHPPEHDVLPVQEIALRRSDEELAAVRIRTGVSLRVYSKAYVVENAGGNLLTIDRRPGPVCFSLKFSSYRRNKHHPYPPAQQAYREFVSVYRERACSVSLDEVTACAIRFEHRV